jgi:hypothetical protein
LSFWSCNRVLQEAPKSPQRWALLPPTLDAPSFCCPPPVPCLSVLSEAAFTTFLRQISSLSRSAQNLTGTYFQRSYNLRTDLCVGPQYSDAPSCPIFASGHDFTFLPVAACCPNDTCQLSVEYLSAQRISETCVHRALKYLSYLKVNLCIGPHFGRFSSSGFGRTYLRTQLLPPGQETTCRNRNSLATRFDSQMGPRVGPPIGRSSCSGSGRSPSRRPISATR